MPIVQEESDQRNRIVYQRKSLSKKAKRRFKFFCIILFIFVIICVLLVFVVFPIVFMNSIALQRLLMFTNLNLPNEQTYFSKYELQPGIQNLYVTVEDTSGDLISLGVWHLLPFIFHEMVITQENFSFDDALSNSNSCVLLYFHGTGEDRSTSLLKYNVFRYFFHVITFDYRGYADSTEGILSEEAVVNDCVQLYEWLTTKTSAPIFIWGHSLGSALATRTAALLTFKSQIAQPIGLILESPFTKMSEELYVHPYGKIFAWLPWFEATVIKPLEENGFIFDTSGNILKISYPIMILNSEDDSIVPYYLGEKLYKIAANRSLNNTTLYYKFPHRLGHDHNFIYEDPFLPYFINYFYFICVSIYRQQRNQTEQYMQSLK